MMTFSTALIALSLLLQAQPDGSSRFSATNPARCVSLLVPKLNLVLFALLIFFCNILLCRNGDQRTNAWQHQESGVVPTLQACAAQPRL